MTTQLIPNELQRIPSIKPALIKITHFKNKKPFSHTSSTQQDMEGQGKNMEYIQFCEKNHNHDDVIAKYINFVQFKNKMGKHYKDFESLYDAYTTFENLDKQLQHTTLGTNEDTNVKEEINRYMQNIIEGDGQIEGQKAIQDLINEYTFSPPTTPPAPTTTPTLPTPPLPPPPQPTPVTIEIIDEKKRKNNNPPGRPTKYTRIMKDHIYNSRKLLLQNNNETQKSQEIITKSKTNITVTNEEDYNTIQFICAKRKKLMDTIKDLKDECEKWDMLESKICKMK